jgi:hypothetical protein
LLFRQLLIILKLMPNLNRKPVLTYKLLFLALAFVNLLTVGVFLTPKTNTLAQTLNKPPASNNKVSQPALSNSQPQVLGANTGVSVAWQNIQSDVDISGGVNIGGVNGYASPGAGNLWVAGSGYMAGSFTDSTSVSTPTLCLSGDCRSVWPGAGQVIDSGKQSVHGFYSNNGFPTSGGTVNFNKTFSSPPAVTLTHVLNPGDPSQDTLCPVPNAYNESATSFQIVLNMHTDGTGCNDMYVAWVAIGN